MPATNPMLCLVAVNLYLQLLRNETRRSALALRGQWLIIRMVTGHLGDRLLRTWRMHHTSASTLSNHRRSTRVSSSKMIHSTAALQLPLAHYSLSALQVSLPVTCRKVRCSVPVSLSKGLFHPRSRIPIPRGGAKDTDARTAFVSPFIRP